jgi:hypothetical protein
VISRDDILAEVEKELDDVLAGRPSFVERRSKAVRDEAIGYANCVLNTLTTQELLSAGAYNRFVENHAGAGPNADAHVVNLIVSSDHQSISAPSCCTHHAASSEF